MHRGGAGRRGGLIGAVRPAADRIAYGATTAMGRFDAFEMAIRIPALLLALTVHEFAHAYSAYRLGDPTAFRLGRCTLNPLAHLDPLGAICLLFAPIGWAKPVPVNPLNFDNPGRDDIIVSISGPLSNLAQAFLFSVVLRGVIAAELSIKAAGGPYAFSALFVFCYVAVLMNCGLAVFNLIPLYPLDGFHVFGNLAKGPSRERFYQMAPLGPYMILGLVFLSHTAADPLGRVIHPVQAFFLQHVAGVGS